MDAYFLQIVWIKEILKFHIYNKIISKEKVILKEAQARNKSYSFKIYLPYNTLKCMWNGNILKSKNTIFSKLRNVMSDLNNF